MISIGAKFGGPSPLLIRPVIESVMQSIAIERGDYPAPNGLPSLNVVFHVSGTTLKFDTFTQIEAVRYTRKTNMLLVIVPVPDEILASNSLTQVITHVLSSLHEANEVAAAAFKRKGEHRFDLTRADSIVENARPRVIADMAASGHEL